MPSVRMPSSVQARNTADGDLTAVGDEYALELANVGHG
jgi:hypothetical protein